MIAISTLLQRLPWTHPEGTVGQSPPNFWIFAFLHNAEFIYLFIYYFHRRLASEGIVTVSVTLCACVRRISLGGEGNALYPVLSSLLCNRTAGTTQNEETDRHMQ